MLLYHDNILCISGTDIICSDSNPNGLIKKSLWDKWIRDGAKVVQRGGRGRSSLIAFDSIPTKWQVAIKEKVGAPEKAAVNKTFQERISVDANAVTFYTNYLIADGRHLPEKNIKEYCVNANVLNALHTIHTDEATSKKPFGRDTKGFWKKASELLNRTREEIGHTLPANHESLFRCYKKYVVESYNSLVSKKFCNDNTVKVSKDLERLLMSLYVMPNKPFASDVHSLYLEFLKGKIQIIDTTTGELFSPDQFKNKRGEYITITDTTVWNYLNKPQNRAIVDLKRSGQFQYNNTHRPHHHRKAPVFAFSKISMDDRDLPRKDISGNRVKAYYAYDVASGCIVGSAYSRTKDEALFIECIQNMFRLIEAKGFGMPLEVEVENHLVNKFFDDLGMMFPFIRICNPGNSQEKHAEHFNRAKKYGIEKKTQNGIGRWWAKGEAYRVDVAKVNDEFVEKGFTYERLVADDMAATIKYNNSLHPKQKLYPGKTRWEVLCENQNPNAPQVSKPVVYKAIGDRTQTTIKRNQSVTVQYNEYIISNVNDIDKLQPNNYGVEAYYLPNAEGLITEVFLYQNGKFICKANRIAEYSTAKAEWQADVDAANYAEQAKYVAQFDKKVKEGKHNLANLSLLETEVIENAEAEAENLVLIENSPIDNEDSVDDILNDYDSNEWKDKGANDY
jgi:hypothetical protein